MFTTKVEIWPSNGGIHDVPGTSVKYVTEKVPTLSLGLIFVLLGITTMLH